MCSFLRAVRAALPQPMAMKLSAPSFNRRDVPQCSISLQRFADPALATFLKEESKGSSSMRPAWQDETAPLVQAPPQERLNAEIQPEIIVATRSTSATPGGAGKDRMCRICFAGEDAHDNPLISPCLCSGGSRYVHRQCLKQWRESSSNKSKAFYRCQVCHYEYKYRRLDNASLLAHPRVIQVVYTLLLFVAAGLLGYVPVIQRCLEDHYQREFEFHGVVYLMVHFINGFIMLGLVSFVSFIVCDPANGCRPTRCSCSDCTSSCIVDCTTTCISDCTSNCISNCRAPDCGPTDCAAGGDAGDCCGGCLLMLVMVAIMGLVCAIPTTFMWLYRQVNESAGATVQMVENVSARKARRTQKPAAAASANQSGSRQPQQHDSDNQTCNSTGAEAV